MRLTSLKFYYVNDDNPEIISPTITRPSANAGRKELMWKTPLFFFGSVAKASLRNEEAQPRHKPKSLSGGGCVCQIDLQFLVDKGLSW